MENEAGIHMNFSDIVVTFEVALTGNRDKDEQIISYAGMLLGIEYESPADEICRIDIYLTDSAVLRDAIIDYWNLIKLLPKAAIFVDGQKADLNTLKSIWTIYDCYQCRQKRTCNRDYCRTKRGGWDWGCLFLDRIYPVFEEDGAEIDKARLKSVLEEEAGKLRLDICPDFDLSAVLARVDALTKHDPAFKNKNINPRSQLLPMETSGTNDVPAGQDIPETGYNDVGGLDEVVLLLRETIELPLKHPEVLRRLGIPPRKGVLLHGPPGCGKTLLARAVAHESKAAFIPVSGPELITKWHGESEEKLRRLFETARQSQPAIVFFDEIDAIAQSRTADESLRLDSRFTAQLLTLMDGVLDLGRIIVLAATNRPDLLDNALTRPGRFDSIIEVPMPDVQGCEKIFGIHARNLPLSQDVKPEEFATKLHGLTGAEIAFVVREAAYVCLRRTLSLDKILEDQNPLTNKQLESLTITKADIMAALEIFHRRNISGTEEK